jgi:hypothetical protein
MRASRDWQPEDLNSIDHFVTVWDFSGVFAGWGIERISGEHRYLMPVALD